METTINIDVTQRGDGLMPDELMIRVRIRPNDQSSDQYSVILRDLLVENGAQVAIRNVMMGDIEAGNPWWAQVLAVAVSSGGAVTALAVALHKYIDRNKGKKFSLIDQTTDGEDIRYLDISGYSIGDLERALNALDSVQRRLGPRRYDDEERVRLQELVASGETYWAVVLGDLLWQQGDIEGARAAYQKAIDSTTHPTAAAVRMGDLLQREGDIEGARAAYQKAIDSGDILWADVAQQRLRDL